MWRIWKNKSSPMVWNKCGVAREMPLTQVEEIWVLQQIDVSTTIRRIREVSLPLLFLYDMHWGQCIVLSVGWGNYLCNYFCAFKCSLPISVFFFIISFIDFFLLLIVSNNISLWFFFVHQFFSKGCLLEQSVGSFFLYSFFFNN